MNTPGQAKRIVFYADDDPDDLDFVSESFKEQAADIQLLTFKTAVELLQFIQNHDDDELFPCLIILDLNMPILNGKDALSILRNMKKYEEIPVILFTTSNSLTDQQFAEHSNAFFYTKPLTEIQMNVIVKKFLEHCNESVSKQQH